MAALAELPQATCVREVNDDVLAQNRTSETTVSGRTGFHGKDRDWGIRTAPGIQSIERGDESLRDQCDNRRRQCDVGEREITTRDGEAVRLRSEAARDIRNRVTELKSVVGQVSFTTYLHLLKRDLSRAHDLLHNHPSETVFLSIVTLIESALSQAKWKDYTEQQLEMIREAAGVGYHQLQVSYQDYERLRQEFARERIDPRLRIDLDAVELDETTDDEDQKT